MLHFLSKFVMPLEIVLLFVYRHIDPNLSGTHNNQNDYRADGNNCLTPQNHRIQPFCVYWRHRNRHKIWPPAIRYVRNLSGCYRTRYANVRPDAKGNNILTIILYDMFWHKRKFGSVFAFMSLAECMSIRFMTESCCPTPILLVFIAWAIVSCVLGVVMMIFWKHIWENSTILKSFFFNLISFASALI